MRLWLFIKIAWAAPTSLIGLLMALLGAKPYRVIRGQVWQWRSSWGLWAWLNGKNFIATTLGNISIVSPDWIDNETTQKHEAIHTAQAYILGPLFLPFYAICSLVTKMNGGDLYWDNALEDYAYRHESDDSWAI